MYGWRYTSNIKDLPRRVKGFFRLIFTPISLAQIHLFFLLTMVWQNG